MSYFTKEDTTHALKDSAPKTGDMAMENMIRSKESLSDVAHHAGEKVRNIFDSASEEISGAGNAVTTQIRHKPLQSSLIALGVGVIIGMLMRR